ncbi:MAG: 2OG-Fe(II) oxygenase [Actinomycetia bacterium]|nr:2OG-Fe(II) oxygenase [Actinomycetes bacterium]
MFQQFVETGDVTQTLPVHPVDLEPFRAGSAADQLDVARRLDAACRDSGFLLITGHGIPQAACDDVLDGFGAFFDMELEEKRRAVVPDVAANRGYSAVGEEALAYSRGEESPPDLFEAFNVGQENAVGPYFDAYRSFYAPTLWPPQRPELRERWLRYEAAVAPLADTLLEVMAVALDLERSWFVDRSRKAIVTTRAINYERVAGAPAPDPEQMRMGAHTDYGILTILLADDVPGLQVWRQDRWHDVSPPRGSFIVNIGDMLERWTNDRWTSTLHRVVPPPDRIDGPVRRRSVARFLDCEPDRVVECIPSCLGPGDPARYPPVVAGEWLHARVMGVREGLSTGLPQGGS